MATATASDTLNQLLAIVVRSFPSYLSYAKPWTASTDGRALAALELIVADQRALAERITSAVLEGGGQPDPSEYPMEFTDTHDLSLDYSLRQAVRYQHADIAAIQHGADAARDAPEARALIDEALSMAKKHLAVLEGLIADRRGTP
jgi:hypothetical protein